MSVSEQKMLEMAIDAVAARGLNYGKPKDNFARIARFWNVHCVNIGAMPPGTELFSPIDVASMLTLVKIARLENMPEHLDSWVDIAGYAACGAEIGTSEA